MCCLKFVVYGGAKNINYGLVHLVKARLIFSSETVGLLDTWLLNDTKHEVESEEAR